MAPTGPISQFIHQHYRHFNAAALKDAAEGYRTHLEKGGKMMVTFAGAMSTAELGISLAEMIRQNKVHAITCTGANLEEDIFNLVAHEDYVRIPNWRELTPDQEMSLWIVTSTGSPTLAFRKNKPFAALKSTSSRSGKRPPRRTSLISRTSIFYQIIREKRLERSYQIDPKHSWMLAACEKNLPIFVPGWEDSTLGNIFAGRLMEGKIKKNCLRVGAEYMVELANWYIKNENPQGIGFFQIGGGIAGDFPICVVPMLEQDLERNTAKWSYFCQISDSTTSYGSYSGAVPNEKITWGKLDKTSKKYIIESDASIVAPLVFAYVLGL